ncbi:MAG: zinc-binding alcohol dehydrogenase [Pseudomonadota bacterium]
MTRAVWYHGDGTISIDDGVMMAGMGPNDVKDSENFRLDPPVLTMQALYSGISRGTERLVFKGLVPVSEHQRMACPHQEGAFTGAVKYGYCMVARCIHGPDDMVGRIGFALHPHQEHFQVLETAMNWLPDGLPPRRACLIANMETALNILWDSQAKPGDRILIVGGGVLGLLVTALAAQIPDATVTLCDVAANREPVAQSLGAQFCDPQHAPTEQTVVIHTSAHPDGLTTGLNAAAFEARVIEASWYGDRPVSVPLGGAFHSQRLQLISSQVGHIAPSHRGEWDYARRLATAMELLCDDRFDALITGEIAFDDAPDTMPSVFADGAPGFMTVLRYPDR